MRHELPPGRETAEFFLFPKIAFLKEIILVEDVARSGYREYGRVHRVRLAEKLRYVAVDREVAQPVLEALVTIHDHAEIELEVATFTSDG